MACYSNESPIIARPFMFDEAHIPDAIITRDSQRQKLEHCLAPALTGRKPIHAWVCGPSRSRKTGTVKYTLAELERKLPWSYVSCWDACTCYAVVERLVRNLHILGAEAQSLSLKLEGLAKAIGCSQFIVVVDEVDRAHLRPESREVSQIVTSKLNECFASSSSLQDHF